jgi:putative flippase GtrA
MRRSIQNSDIECRQRRRLPGLPHYSGDGTIHMIHSVRRRTAREMVRFLFVGALNTGFGYVVYTVGILAGLKPELALLVTFAIATIFNYRTTGGMVFHNTGARNFPKFAFANLLIYGINVVALRSVLGLDIQPLIAQAIVLPPVVLCTFAIMKLFVFRSSYAQNH